MLNFDVLALDRIAAALQSLKASQIDFHYWRKTPVGVPFANTVACPGGWLCLLQTFQDEGLRLVAVSPLSEWGFVPAITLDNKIELRGYSALGYIVQQSKRLSTTEEYGRALFAFPGRSVFDKKNGPGAGLDAVMNPRGFMLGRLAAAKSGADPTPSRVHYVSDADD